MKAGLMTRLVLVEAALNPEAQWGKSEGLCAILDYAKRLPACDPLDLHGVYQNAPGFGGLLWEARQAQREEEA